MKMINVLFVFFLTLLSSVLCERLHNAVYELRMDEALLTFHSELPYSVSVLYTSDYCYKCLYQQLATVGNKQQNVSVVVRTLFQLTLRILPVDGNRTLCSLSQTFEEAGHYSLWMRQAGLLNDVSCSLTVDKSPHNAYLRVRYRLYRSDELKNKLKEKLFYNVCFGRCPGRGALWEIH